MCVPVFGGVIRRKIKIKKRDKMGSGRKNGRDELVTKGEVDREGVNKSRK